MTRQSGTHVEYSPTGAGGDGPQILRVFGSAIKALWSAVDNGNKVVYVEFGETITEALEREAAAIKPTGAKAANLPSAT